MKQQDMHRSSLYLSAADDGAAVYRQAGSQPLRDVERQRADIKGVRQVKSLGADQHLVVCQIRRIACDAAIIFCSYQAQRPGMPVFSH